MKIALIMITLILSFALADGGERKLEPIRPDLSGVLASQRSNIGGGK